MIKDKIAFLVGSGISINAGMPCTYQITESVLRPPKRYHITGDWEDTEDETYRFTNELRYLCMKYKQKIPLYPNYEDLYYLSYQIYTTSLESEFENPMIIPFCKELEQCFNPAADINQNSGQNTENKTDRFDIKNLAEGVTNHIENKVCQALDEQYITNTNYLSNIFPENIIESMDIDIFSLNHDLVLERFLGEGHYCDGFTIKDMEENEKYRGWDPDSLNKHNGVCLYKIHGSVNWQRYNKNGNDTWCKNGPGHDKRNVPENEHTILCGTYNKMFGYHFGIFAELWARFYLKLMEHNKLIIAGYGFEDRAVNNALSHWCDRENKKIMIIDHKIEGIKNKKSLITGLDRIFNEWINEGKTLIIPKKVECLGFGEIYNFLSP